MWDIGENQVKIAKSVITFADSDDQLVLFSSHLHFQHLTITLQVAKQLAIELDRQNLFL